jgi:integrase
MSVRKRGKKGVWYMNFQVGGERVNRPILATTKKEAEQIERETRAKLEKELLLPPSEKPNKMLLSEAIERTYKEKWKSNQGGSRAYERAKLTLKFMGDKVVSEITSNDITRLIDKLKKKKRKNSTVNRHLSLLRTVLNLCLKKWGAISKLPYIEFLEEPVGRLRMVTQKEEEQILTLLRLQGYTEMVDLVIVLVDTGARLGNILRLEYKDVNFQTGMIHFWKTKQKKPYSVPMTKRVKEVLQKRQGNGDKPFNLTANQAEKAWRHIKKLMGLEMDKDFVLHCLRHTCASRLVEKGIDLYVVKEWLGHSSIQVTERYAHLQPKGLKEALKILEA